MPNEPEWEKAARGTDGRLWPWGNNWQKDRANTQETSLNQTSPVGLFPEGASPTGVEDIAGNVWEWTRSCWGRTSLSKPDYGYPYDALDGREKLQGPDFPVLRGGSWRDDQRLARCAARLHVPPGDFGIITGFRVVVSLANSDF